MSAEVFEVEIYNPPQPKLVLKDVPEERNVGQWEVQLTQAQERICEAADLLRKKQIDESFSLTPTQSSLVASMVALYDLDPEVSEYDVEPTEDTEVGPLIAELKDEVLFRERRYYQEICPEPGLSDEEILQRYNDNGHLDVFRGIAQEIIGELNEEYNNMIGNDDSHFSSN